MTEHLRDEVTRLTPEQIKERLAPEMAPRAGERVLGSQLGEMINRALFPHGTYREYRKQGTTARLRTFVEEYADGLVEITADKQGADSFYRILGSSSSGATAEPAPLTLPAPDAGHLWRTFVAVNSSLCVVFDPKTAAVRAVPTSKVPEDTKLIESVSLPEHRNLMVGFLSALHASGRVVPALQQIESTYTTNSYPEWLKVLRREKPPLDKEWGEFRQAQLQRLFRERLEKIGVGADRIEQLATELERDHAQAIAAKDARRRVHSSSEAQSSPSSSREKRARDALQKAIERMTFEQIQQIQLPLGVFLPLLGIE